MTTLTMHRGRRAEFTTDEHHIVLGFTDLAGRLVITELRGPRLTGRLVNTLPLRRIEEAANRPDYAELLREPYDDVTELSAEIDWDDDPEPLPRMKAPTGRKYPDDFYIQLADLLVDHSESEISLAYDVPMSTVSRWVKEARRRQLMAPSALVVR